MSNQDLEMLEQQMLCLIKQSKQIKRQKKRIRLRMEELEEEISNTTATTTTTTTLKKTRSQTKKEMENAQACLCMRTLNLVPVFEKGWCYGQGCIRKDGTPKRFSVPLYYYSCDDQECYLSICQSCFKAVSVVDA
jgi:hypothetical protein